MKTRAVIFDLDGTLLDTLDDLAASCNAALKAHGFPERTRDEVRQFVGNGLAHLMELALPGGKGNPHFAECLESMREHYAKHCRIKTQPYRGIMQLLETLSARGVRCAVVSNKPDAQVKELCRAYFAPFVEARCALGDTEGRRRKPAPDSVLEAMAQLGVRREEALYVGDSEVDLQTAASSGLLCVSATWGFRREPLLVQSGATHLAHTPQDVLPYLTTA